MKLPGGFNVPGTHRTLSDALKDRPAADVIMGHVDPSVASYYREVVSGERLQAVVDHVRGWLLAGRQETHHA